MSGVMTKTAALERQREGMLKQVELYRSLERLKGNADFRKSILQNFLVDDCARNIRASVLPSMGEKDREFAAQMAQAAGHFENWMTAQESMGRSAEAQLMEIDEAIVASRQEDDEDASSNPYGDSQ